MAVHISDSAIFANSWTTPILRAHFEDTALLQGWIEVMVVLAETQSEFGLIPAEAAGQLKEVMLTLELDRGFLEEVREGFEHSNHSLFGLIKALQRRSPGNSGEWWCYGATVQDITDSHNARLLMQAGAILVTRIDNLLTVLCELSARYRDTPMCGRTHGQPGLPITFGFKAAGWLDEMYRHHQRLNQTIERIGVGQLAGGVGSLSSLGPEALALQQRFLENLGLKTPAISWTVARDRLAEWLNLLALLTATADRIGHEIYNLQRPEIGELSEGFVSGTVGSITMPQKRNPEISEHLGTLARQVRYQAAQMNENLVHDHERDGRSWKSEWAIVPGACLATDKALVLLQILLEHLQVNETRMLDNISSTNGFVYAESVMLALAAKLGKQSAHSLVYKVAMAAAEQSCSFKSAVLVEPEITSVLDTSTIETLFDLQQSTGCCAQMVDRVLAEVRGRED